MKDQVLAFKLLAITIHAWYSGVLACHSACHRDNQPAQTFLSM